MKKSIYVVGPNGAKLNMSGGDPAVAIRPAGKGETGSWALLESGRMVMIKGQRINGIGIERYVSDLGFVPAPPGHPLAEVLADKIAVRDSITLVEEASEARAKSLQQAFGGQRCTVVPFSPRADIQPAVIAVPDGCIALLLGIGIGISAGVVKVKYEPSDPSLRTSDIDLANYWIVGPGVSPYTVPRATRYGGPVEHAAFVIVNSGLAEFVGPQNLTVDENAPEDDPFIKGRLTLKVTGTDDEIIVGIDSGDTLVVQYLRDGVVIAERKGLESSNGSINLGMSVGSIAAVMLKARELDQQTPAKRAKLKKAA